MQQTVVWKTVYNVHGIFHSRLKTSLFSKSFSPYSNLFPAKARLLEFDHSMFGNFNGGGNIGECGRLSQLNWLRDIIYTVSQKKFPPLNSL